MILWMKEYGENLGTRALGQIVRSQITDALRTSSEQIILDFEGIRVMTQSFADELFRKLIEDLPRETITSRLGIRNAALTSASKLLQTRGREGPTMEEAKKDRNLGAAD
jgi:STAS-like domain of unknown function (DUF4325)